MKKQHKFHSSILKKILEGFLFFVIYLAVIFIVNMVVGVYHFQTIEKENQRLQYIYNIIQIAMTFFIAGSGIFAVRQYYKYCKSEEKRFQTEYVQKAIDLSGFYKDSILTKYRAILYVYNKSGIINILEKIKKKDMKFFCHPFEKQILFMDLIIPCRMKIL